MVGEDQTGEQVSQLDTARILNRFLSYSAVSGPFAAAVFGSAGFGGVPGETLTTTSSTGEGRIGGPCGRHAGIQKPPPNGPYLQIEHRGDRRNLRVVGVPGPTQAAAPFVHYKMPYGWLNGTGRR